MRRFGWVWVSVGAACLALAVLFLGGARAQWSAFPGAPQGLFPVFVGNHEVHFRWQAEHAHYEVWRDNQRAASFDPLLGETIFYRDQGLQIDTLYQYNLCWSDPPGALSCYPDNWPVTTGQVNGFIFEDTTWSGEVFRLEIVQVVNSATLRIEAGAVITPFYSEAYLQDRQTQGVGGPYPPGRLVIEAAALNRTHVAFHQAHSGVKDSLFQGRSDLTLYGENSVSGNRFYNSHLAAGSLSGAEPYSATISNNDFYTGGVVIGGKAQAAVSGNRFFAGSRLVAMILVWEDGAAEIAGNTLVNLSSVPLVQVDTSGWVILTGNLLSTTASIGGVLLKDASQAVIEGNTFACQVGECLKVAAAFPAASPVALRKNILTSGLYPAFHFYGGGTIAASHNTLLGARGVKVEGDGDRVALHDNCIAVSQGGLSLEYTRGTLQAGGNWWGDESGPRAADNPQGKGSSISVVGSGGLVYRPFLTSGNCATQDFLPAGIEAVQTVQSQANGVELIAGKPTALRVYVDLWNASPMPVPVQLTFRSPSGLLGQETRTANALPIHSWDELRADGESGLVYTLPDAWLTGTLTVTAEVNPGESLPEAQTANNLLTQTLKFSPMPVFRIVYVPVDYLPAFRSGRGLPEMGGVLQAQQMLETLFPVPRAEYVVAPPLEWIDSVQDEEFFKDYLAAWVSMGQALKGSATLFADEPFWVALVFRGEHVVSEKYPQEVFCTDGPDCLRNLGFLLELEPLELGRLPLEWPYADPSIHEFGYDLAGRRVVPRETYDFMLAEDPRWISPWNHKKLIPEIKKVMIRIKSPAAPAGETLLVSGWLSQTGQVSFAPLWQESLPAVDAPTGGPYCLELRTAADAVLDRQCFTPDFSGAQGMPAGRDFFLLHLQAAPQARRAVLLKEAAELGRVEASAHAPQVHLDAPAGGGAAGDGLAVRWTAQDDDGGELASRVFYSGDDGVSWLPVALELRGAQALTLPLAAYPGSAAARLRVQVSDGFSSAQDDSDAAFTVADHAPWAAIFTPQAGAVISAGQPVLLSGAAYDLEDGALGGGALTWSSDRDGALGAGEVISGVLLTPGVHRLTLSAADSAAHLGSQSISLTVQAPQVWRKTYLPLAQRK